MRTIELVGKHSAEPPKDAKTPSHQLLVRGGYIRQVGQGIYSMLPLGQRVCAKIEALLRAEMNAIGGQEVRMPVVTPAELWQESGRYEAVGEELARFEDRTGHPLVLSMTNEETAVDLVRASIESYRQLPVMIYQFQTKFRDEPRSRAGLIRAREFVMKDAYSFHRTKEDLGAYYERCREAYHRLFRQCGLGNVVDIESAVGMMGGRVAHEFMLLSPHGEDSILLCGQCGYRANREVVPALRAYASPAPQEPLTEVETSGTKTVEQLQARLGIGAAQICKAVLLSTDQGRPVVAFIRGDLEIDQTKLRAALSAADLRLLREDEITSRGLVPGFVGPLGVDAGRVELRFDRSVVESANLVIGANQVDRHLLNFNCARDLAHAPACDISQVVQGDPCPSCGSGLRAERGIEVGNIFQLGTKYTESMHFTYAEEDGSQRTPTMGCYGIGIGRTMACIVEENHDERGPLWPASVAPFAIQICALQARRPEITEAAESLYRQIGAAGGEVLLDTREISAGVAFADADLVGAPIRVIVSPRNLGQGVLELKYRTPTPTGDLPPSLRLEDAGEALVAISRSMADAARDTRVG